MLGDRNPGAGDDIGSYWRRPATVGLADHPWPAQPVAAPLPAGERNWFHDGLDVTSTA